jgi:hypothetical protein
MYIKQSSIISVINCWLFNVQRKIVHANSEQEQIQQYLRPLKNVIGGGKTGVITFDCLWKSMGSWVRTKINLL